MCSTCLGQKRQCTKHNPKTVDAFDMSKKYGLILPGKGNPAPSFNASKNVFGEESDSEPDEKIPKAPLMAGERLKRQVQKIQAKAVEEDPTVYQYDELYDTMESNKKEVIEAKQKDRKPKYVHKLLEAANRRKRENERRVERQVQKEREEEGSKFDDKESYVTSSYKKKLEELREEEERERREQYLEEIGDVTKQADLGGFYRHLYDQQVKSKDDTQPAEDKQTPLVEKVEPEKPDDKPEKTDDKPDKSKAKRIYRKRKLPITNEESDKSDEEDGIQNYHDVKAGKKEMTHLPSNIDADSDFSIDDTSSDDDNEGVKKDKKDKKKSAVKLEESNDKVQEPQMPPDETEVKPEIKVEELNTDIKIDEDEPVEPEEEIKPKIDIWKKRTVGEVFEEALRRYWERKNNRLQNSKYL